MEELIKDYERRLKTIKEMQLNDPLNIRLNTKASCYRTFIAELKRIK